MNNGISYKTVKKNKTLKESLQEAEEED